VWRRKEPTLKGIRVPIPSPNIFFPAKDRILFRQPLYVCIMILHSSIVHTRGVERKVMRMFVEFSLSALGLGKPQKNFANLLTTARITFPVHTSLEQNPNG